MTAEERRGKIAAIKELPILLEGALRGLRPERGEISLARVRAIYAEHGRKHVEQITKLREAQGW